jgi:hypothetical protein
LEATMGGAEHSYRIVPQAHPPENGTVMTI